MPLEKIELLHENEGQHRKGKWTILSWLPQIHRKFEAANPKWFVFLESNTVLPDPDKLETFFGNFDPSKSHFLGHGLKDKDHNIMAVIHHYHQGDFEYPFLSAGFAISSTAMKEAISKISDEPLGQDTHIDISHEFAKWLQDKIGLQMNSRTEVFCADVKDDPGCVFGASQLVRMDHKATFKDIVIGIKTTKSFHDVRIPIIKATYGNPDILPTGLDFVYMSDHEDSEIPTVDLTKEWGKQVHFNLCHCICRVWGRGGCCQQPCCKRLIE